MRYLITLILFISLSFPAIGQRHELVLFGGISSYKGELNDDLFNTDVIHAAFGLHYRYNINSHYSLRLALNRAALSGADSNSNYLYDKVRNLSFTTNYTELAGIVEFNFFPYFIGNKKWPVSPFIFSGLSVFGYNPKAEYNDEMIELQPLGTEGQGTNLYPDREKYKLTQGTFMVGGGIKFSVSKRIGVNLELGIRQVFSDYLDDVSTTYVDRSVLIAENGSLAAILSDRSYNAQNDNYDGKQRGNSTNPDRFMVAGISLAIRLGNPNKVVCDSFK